MRRNASAAVAAVATRAGSAAGPTTANRLAASGQRSRACPGPTSSRCSSAGAWVITTSKSPFAAARRICPDGATTVVRGAGPVQSDSSTASAPDCCTVYVVPSRKGAGPARQAAAMRNTAATRFMPVNLPYRECSSGCTFQEVAPCNGAGMVTPMPVTRRLWAPITFVTIALVACKGTEPFVPVPTSLHVDPSTLSFNSLGATRQVVAVVLDQRADTRKHASVNWSSRHGGAGTVSGSRLVTSVGNAGTYMGAKLGGLRVPVSAYQVDTRAQLIKASGDGQTGVVRATLPSALTLEVVDAGNRPMTGATGRFPVTLGGGSLSNPSGPTDGSGLTTIQWTLGTTPGQPQLVQASLAGTSVSPATFSATATAGPPASATKLVGDNQTAATNNPVSTPPSVQVSDSYGDHVPGVTVTFAATAGGGTVSGGATQTDANGVATGGPGPAGAA